MQIAGKRSYFWENLIRAAEALPHEARSIRGKSGLVHPVVALGVDDARSRLIVVSGEHDARTTALAQVDIQAALPSMQVVMARPVLFNPANFAESLLISPETGSADPSRLLSLEKGEGQDIKAQLKKYMRKIEATFDVAPLGVSSQVLQVASILTQLNWDLFDEILNNKEENTAPVPKKKRKKASKDEDPLSPKTMQAFASLLLQLVGYDPIGADRDAGLCPLPLYEFSMEEVEAIRSGKIDDLQHLLREHQLLQYFFPPPDQLALGMVERAPLKPSQLVSQLLEVPNMGHPFGRPELSIEPSSIPRVIENLQARDLFVEGEFGLELTEKGQTVRASIRFKPREGLLEKLFKRFKFNVDLKNLIGK